MSARSGRLSVSLRDEDVPYLLFLDDIGFPELRNSFGLRDSDRGGIIATRDVKTVMRSLGLTPPSKKEMKEIIKEADKDGHGEIDFQDFVKVMAKRIKDTDTEEDLRKAFQTFDPDRLGYISAHDLRTVMTTLGEKMTSDEVNEFLKAADKRGDGKINYVDFIRDVLISGFPV